LYQIVSKTDTQILKAQVASKKQALKSADENMLRVFKLNKNAVVSAKKLDESKERQSEISFELQELEAKLSQAIAMESVSSRRHYNHKEFSSDLDIAAVELQTLYLRLQIEKEQLSDLNARQNGQVVRAPFTGKIMNVFHASESSLSKNEPVLVFEETSVITVTAYLDQEEVLEVGLQDLATVYVPALDQHFDAMITKIDRNSAYINNKTARYTWKDKKEKTALVSLEIFSQQHLSEMLSAGLPAVVIFNRRTTSSFVSKALNFYQQEQDGTSRAVSSTRGAYDSI